ncbi:MAG TPA: hypothetical protein VGH16_16250 [Candidatus Binatia bacterium]|jgi:type II secretory pathway component GspD/PulD (secretin)
MFILHCFSTGVRAAEPPPSPPATPPNTARPPGGFIGQALQISNAPAAEIKKVVQSLITQGGAVLDQPGGKSLMIVDTTENFHRLTTIKDTLDVPAFANARFDVYQPKGESAEELAREINEIQRNLVPRSARSAFYAVPLPVANVLLVISRSEEAWNTARVWLQKIDRPGTLPRQVYVYPLDSKEAEQAAVAAVAANPLEKKPSIRRGFQVTFDPPTRTLIVHATPGEFQELKNRLNPDATFAEFKQRVTTIAQEFSPEPPPVAGTPKPANKSAF